MSKDLRRIDIRRIWDPAPSTISVASDIATTPPTAQDAPEGRTVFPGVGFVSGEREAAEAELLPAPSAELVLIRVMVSAYLATAPRRRSEAFLRQAAKLLENEEAVSLLLPMRPPAQQAELSRARREAVAMFRQLLPVLIASVAGGA